MQVEGMNKAERSAKADTAFKVSLFMSSDQKFLWTMLNLKKNCDLTFIHPAFQANKAWDKEIMTWYQFQLFDRNKDGFITREEFVKVKITYKNKNSSLRHL